MGSGFGCLGMGHGARDMGQHFLLFSFSDGVFRFRRNVAYRNVAYIKHNKYLVYVSSKTIDDEASIAAVVVTRKQDWSEDEKDSYSSGM